MRCASAAEIFAFNYHKLGENGLRQLLGMFGDFTCEFFERSVNELAKVGCKAGPLRK